MFLKESSAIISRRLQTPHPSPSNFAANYMPARAYYVKQSLTELEQYKILLQKALMGKSPFELNVILTSAHAEGVGTDIIDVARLLYVEPKKQEHINLVTITQTSGESSNTGC